MRLFRVVMHHFICGVVANEAGRIVKAAPLMQWCVGKTVEQVRCWANAHGGSLEAVQ